MPGCRCLHILFVTAFSLGLLVRPLYAEETELEKATRLVKQVTQLYQQGRYAEAVPIAEEILSINEKSFGPEDTSVAGSLDILTLVYTALGDYVKAEALQKRALQIREKAFGPEHPEVAKSLNSLAEIYYNLGDYVGAEPFCKRALEIFENALGPEHSEVAECLTNLAKIYKALGDYVKAEPLYRRALAIKEKVLGPNHRYVARSLNDLASLYCILREYTKAEPLYERALAIGQDTLGPGHPNVAICLGNLGQLYCNVGDYPKAESLYKRALAIRERVFGTEHPDVASSLNALGGVYYYLGDYDQAELLHKRALEIRKKVLGPNHPNVAASLNDLAVLYCSIGDYAKAQPLYESALEIKKQNYGPEHPDVAVSLNNLAEFYNSMGEYSKAESLHKRALAIREKKYGYGHPDVATSLNNLAGVYCALGEYAKAEPLYQRATDIGEKVFGPNHPNVAASLGNLAGLYCDVGDYAKARSLHKIALGIKERTLGPQHPDVATSLNNLAGVYYAIGDYVRAETLYQKALEIKEKVFGPEHPDVAASLNNLGVFYEFLGDHTKAETFHKRSLKIKEKIYGPEHPDVATSLSNLAGLYYSLGEYATSEPLLKRALEIREEVFGPEHPGVAASLNNLAELYRALGEYAKVESFYKRSLGIWQSIFGPNHPNVASSLNNLGLLYQGRGAYAKAESLHKKSLTIREHVFGSEHPDVAASLKNLALLYAAMSQFEQSYSLLKLAQEIDTRFIDEVMGVTSEDQKIKFLCKVSPSLHVFLSLVNQHLSQKPSARKDALDVWLKRKGVILEVQRRFQEAMVYSDDPEAAKTFQELSRLRTRLSRLAFAGPGKEALDAYKKKAVDLEVQKEKLEANLSRLSRAFALKQKIARANCEKVAGALPANTALIELARVVTCNFKAKEKENRWSPAHYIAFVLHSGKGHTVGMLDLGDAKRIDSAVVKLKKDIAKIKDFKEGKTVHSSKVLYKMVFEPLRKELGDVKEIFISPDGILNLLPFEVLMGPDGRYLIEDFTFNYLSSGRDVIGFGQVVGEGKSALIMGDPDFDLCHEEKKVAILKMALMDGEKEKPTRRSADMRGFQFTRLPGAEEEVRAIQKILGDTIETEAYLGSRALEEVLKQKNAPKILHLATHGFFLEDQERDRIPTDPTERGFFSVTMPIKEKRNMVRTENPMLRSGFALAGANRALQEVDEDADDGIVTSEEILGLRLRGTDLVVLSACDTGLGEVKTGEGVFGLRRAFSQAGAKSLIMSLWAVPDKETRELMVAFYKNIMTGQINRCQALRQAALKEMKIVKKRYGHAHPFFWGGFVMVGDPGEPLVTVNVE